MKIIRIICWLGILAAGGIHVSAGEMLTSAIMVRNHGIKTEEAAKPVRLEGILTFIDPLTGRAFLQDATGGVSVFLKSEVAGAQKFKSGSRVSVEGVAAPGQFLPRVEGPGGTAARIQWLGDAELPAARPVTGSQLAQPAMDSQWVEIWGVIRPPVAPYLGATVALESEGRTFFVYMPEGISRRDVPPSLLGIRVKVRAVAGTFVNDRRQMTRRVLFMPSLDSITTEKELIRDDPFQRPLTAFDDLMRAHTQGAAERAKVRGIAMLALPDEGLFLREANNGGLWVQTSQRLTSGMIHAGDIIEAVGWPEASDFRPVLRGAVFRVTGRGQPVDSISASPESLLEARHHANLVSTEGTFIRHVDGPLGIRLLLSHNDVVFEARISKSISREPLAIWTRDSRLRITGICENVPGEGAANPQISPTFFIQIRSLDDIKVLSSPPWWSTRRILWAFGVTIGGTLLAAAWAFFLRRRVAFQTKVIEAQVHRAGAQDERQRLARELHDSLEQEMMGVGLQLETALARIEQDPFAARNSVERARRLLHRAQQETRETIWDLRSSPSDPNILPGLLEELLGPVAEAAGCQMKVICSEGLPEGMPNSLIHHLVRIAQESVTNSTKHGEADHITVAVDFADDRIRLTVRDDGCGFQPGKVPGANQGHFGLTGMQERASKCGGEVSVKSEQGKGTEIVFSAPLPLKQ